VKLWIPIGGWAKRFDQLSSVSSVRSSAAAANCAVKMRIMAILEALSDSLNEVQTLVGRDKIGGQTCQRTVRAPGVMTRLKKCDYPKIIPDFSRSASSVKTEIADWAVGRSMLIL
jgi:hypothetical protein